MSVTIGPWKPAPPVAPPPPPIDDPQMEPRVRAVENAVTSIEAKLPFLATGKDVAELKNSIMTWTISTTLAVLGLLLAILPRLIQTPAQPSPAPIYIQQAPAPTTAPAPQPPPPPESTKQSAPTK